MEIKLKEMAKALSKGKDLSQKEAREYVEFLLAFLRENIACGNTVELLSIGRFETIIKPPHEGYHPITREKTLFPAKAKLVFKPKLLLKDQVSSLSVEEQGV